MRDPSEKLFSSAITISKSRTGSAAGGFRDVHQMDQQARAFDVTQELYAQAVAQVRSFNQAGDVGDHEAAIFTGVDHAQIRDQGGEGIIRDLGARCGDAGDQSRLARVGESDEADIGQEF